MISVWQLTRGELFRAPGCPVILEFARMDGMYARCYTRSGQMVSIGGYVEALE